jgi:hypothetical protein
MRCAETETEIEQSADTDTDRQMIECSSDTAGKTLGKAVFRLRSKSVSQSALLCCALYTLYRAQLSHSTHPPAVFPFPSATAKTASIPPYTHFQTFPPPFIPSHQHPSAYPFVTFIHSAYLCTALPIAFSLPPPKTERRM